MNNIFNSVLIFSSVYVFAFIIMALIWHKYKILNKPRFSLKNHIIKIGLLFLTTVPFSVLCGYRDINTGYDTHNYINRFYEVKYGLSNLFETLSIPAYKGLLCITYAIDSETPTFFLFFMASISLFFSNMSLINISRNSLAFCLGGLLFLLYFSPIMLDQSRQFIVIGLVMCSFYEVLLGHKWASCLWFLLAFLFHESVAALIPFYIVSMLPSIKRKEASAILIASFAVSIFFIGNLVNIIINFLPTEFEYISKQANHSVKAGNAWIIDIIPMSILLLIYYFSGKRQKSVYNLLPVELCAISAIPFRLAGYFSFFIMRLSYFGEALSIMLFILIFQEMSRRKQILLSFIICVFFAIVWYVRFAYLGLNGAIPYEFSK